MNVMPITYTHRWKTYRQSSANCVLPGVVERVLFGDGCRLQVGEGRSRGQAIADTLVERVTRRSAAAATPIAVNLVLSDETLLGGASAPAEVFASDPIPAAVACALVSPAVTDCRSRATLRRL